MIRVAFLDDHPAVRAGLQAILSTEPDLQVVGFAAGEHELWPLVRETRPAVMILDLHHPGRDGLALCLRIKRQPDPPAVVLYSGYTTGALVVAAAVVGAGAVVSKSSTAASLVEAIRAVARNPRIIPPITSQMKAEAAAMLDPADHAILAMRVAGDSLVEIAATLGVPEATIAHRIAAMVAELEQLRTAA
jgi:DNA-binding NarL/FixJ family response regulator